MNSELLNKIILVIEEIFDCYSSLGDDILNISKIEELKKLEDEYVSLLPKKISSLEEISIAVGNSYNSSSSIKKHFVMNRFDNILEILKEVIEESSTSKEILEEACYDSYRYYNLMNEKIVIDLIGELEDNKLKYFLVYSNPRIENQLLKKGFNVNKLGSISDENMKKTFLKDDTKYTVFSDEVLDVQINKLLFEIITLCKNDDSANLIVYNLDVLKLLLSKLSVGSLSLKRKQIVNSNLISDNELKLKLLSFFPDIDFTIDDELEENLEDFTDEQCLDLDVFDKLVSLIKLEEVILSRYDSLDLSDVSSISMIVNLLDYEKDIVSSIDLYDDASKFIDIILKDSSFFFNGEATDRKSKLIGNRIYNLFPAFREISFNNISISLYDLVISNHIVNSLCSYRNIMCDLDDDNFNIYVKTYKDIIFIYPELLNDIMVLNGDFTALFSYDDEFCSNILKIGSDRSIVYSFDKDEILYDLASKIILELNDIIGTMDKNPDLFSLYEFKICEFNDIIDNINTEHLYALEADIESISNLKIRSILMNNLSLQHKY